MELKDIVLKKGDIVYFIDETWYIDNAENGKSFYDVFENDSGIVKIERPIKYETIYEAPKEILDKEEKDYLEHFLRPFRNEKIVIKKTFSWSKYHYLMFIIGDNRAFCLPDFIAYKMYKGMELHKEYTLEELGLFKEE